MNRDRMLENIASFNERGVSQSTVLELAPLAMELLGISKEDYIKTAFQADIDADYLKKRRNEQMKKIHPDNNNDHDTTEKAKQLEGALRVMNYIIKNGLLSKIQIPENSNDYDEPSVNVDTPNRDDDNVKNDSASDSSDDKEYYPGTNIPKPRYRGDHETDAEYLIYLEEYFKNIEGLYNQKSDIDKKQDEIKEADEKLKEAIEKYAKLIKEFEQKQEEIKNNGFKLSPEEFKKFQDDWNQRLYDAYSEIVFYQIKKEELEKDLENLKRKQKEQNKYKELEDKRKGDEVLGIEQKPQPKPEPPKPDPIGIEQKPEPKPQPEPGPQPGPQPGPGPGPDPEPKPEEVEEIIREIQPEPEPKPELRGKTLDRILAEITNGIEVKQKDNKKLTASNIKITKMLQSKIKTGNWVYNRAGTIPALVSVPFATLAKIWGKITTSKKCRDRIDKLTENIKNMSEEDLMVVYKEYRGSLINNYGMPDIVNTLLGQRISKFVQEKVNEINTRITELYGIINRDFHQIRMLEKQIGNPALGETIKNSCRNQLAQLYSGKAEIIKEIQDKQIEAANWFSGGEHGFAEDMKAAKTKMSIVGYRFAKHNDLNSELMGKQADYADAIKAAINENDDKKALAAFIGREKLLSDNTTISNSIFGKRSTGDRYYSPLVTEMNYKDDTFIRDLFTTIAIVGSAINIAGSVKQAREIAEAQAKANQGIDAANANIRSANDQIHSYGQQIENQTGSILKGQEANIRQGEIGGMNTQERMDLDANNWKFTNSYHEADRAAHIEYNESYWNIDGELSKIADSYGRGAINSVQAFEQMANLTSQAQSRLTAMYQTYEPILTEYAATHPQFDLTGLQDGINNLISDPNIMMDAAQAQVEIAKIGQTLQQFNIPADIQGINISTNIIPALIGASSAMALVANVNSQMSMNARVGKYGNEVTQIVENLSAEEVEEFARAAGL